MKILYVSYSCDPYNGSEDKLGWNIPFWAAKKDEVIVVTKKEHEEVIKKYMKENSSTDIKFYFVDIPKFYKRVFKGFLYSGRLNIWLKKAKRLIKQLCKTERVDIIHQVTPIEFRAIGSYYNIPGVKFVVGPLGGGESIPTGLKCYAKRKRSVEVFRSAVNRWSRLKLKINGKLKKCDCVLFANYETASYLGWKGKLNVVTETGTDILGDEAYSSERKTEIPTFLFAGSLVYRKGLEFFFDCLKKLPKEVAYKVKICGAGEDEHFLKEKAKEYGLEGKVEFLGKVAFEKMNEEYKKADAFIMPSLRETCGAVILESLSNGLPIITFNAYGGKLILDDDVAWFIEGKTQEEYINNCADILLRVIHGEKKDKEKIFERVQGFTWEEKMRIYEWFYKSTE